MDGFFFGQFGRKDVTNFSSRGGLKAFWCEHSRGRADTSLAMITGLIC